jgi:hypothetical protein
VHLAFRVGDLQAVLALGLLAEADTVPVISASVPTSFGLRASNSSATRGRPPVMSRVFWPSIGMRASTSPGIRSWPSRTWISAPTGKPMVTEWSVPGIFTSLPARRAA